MSCVISKPAAFLVGAGLALHLAGCSAMKIGAGTTVPPGAAALGYTKCVIAERPSVADIAPGDAGAYKWFNSQWCRSPLPISKYEMVQGVLAVHPWGDLVSTPRDMASHGKLPLLPGRDGFYVEFDVRLSTRHRGCFPAVWLMPVEHNRRLEDHYPGDPDKFMRWMELDVDEGNFPPNGAIRGTVLNWSGIWPNYKAIHNPNLNSSKIPLDRTQRHTFGASYDPVGKTCAWWVDGVKSHAATAPYVPDSATQQHFYLIISAQVHTQDGTFSPHDYDYQMFVSGVRAYVPPNSPLPAVQLTNGD